MPPYSLNGDAETSTERQVCGKQKQKTNRHPMRINADSWAGRSPNFEVQKPHPVSQALRRSLPVFGLDAESWKLYPDQGLLRCRSIG